MTFFYGFMPEPLHNPPTLLPASAPSEGLAARHCRNVFKTSPSALRSAPLRLLSAGRCDLARLTRPAVLRSAPLLSAHSLADENL
ncbi:MAG: hypothetical protein J6T60_04480 [Bacteroidales bacterium]|nr:hypothetical protein [Bacteroidales bacterium]